MEQDYLSLVSMSHTEKTKTFPLTYQGPLYWNELCQHLSSKPSKLSFTRNLKIKLIDQRNFSLTKI